MPTTYTDQFFVMDPGAPPPVGTNLTPVTATLIDADDDGFIEVGETVNGGTVTSVWEGDEITVTMGGATVTITGTTFYITGQPAMFTPTDGSILSNAVFQSSDFVTVSTQQPVSGPGGLGPSCFTAGTLIETVDGPRLIETLHAGDQIVTADSGLQTLLWVGMTEVRAVGDFAPIHFEAGAIGNDRPLLVSPQHRMLVTDWQAQLFYGEAEVFVAAKHLVNGSTITRQEGGSVRYMHLLFAQHEIVKAEGAWSESFFPEQAMTEADPDMVRELELFAPQMLRPDHKGWELARRQVKSFEATVLAA